MLSENFERKSYLQGLGFFKRIIQGENDWRTSIKWTTTSAVSLYGKNFSCDLIINLWKYWVGLKVNFRKFLKSDHFISQITYACLYFAS